MSAGAEQTQVVFLLHAAARRRLLRRASMEGVNNSVCTVRS